MADRDVTIICAAADKDKANAMTTAAGWGICFSIPLATTPGITNPALATHWAGSGYIPEELVAALDVSLDPMVKVYDNQDGTGFPEHLLMVTPQPLHRIYEEI